MGFDISFKWLIRPTDAVARNEELAQSLMTKFPSLTRFELDFNKIAESMDVRRDEVLSHWCQIELDDDGHELCDAIITFWPESVVIELPSRPALGIPGTLKLLDPLFNTLREAGLETDAEFDVQREYEMQKARVEVVSRIVSEDE